MKRVVRTRKKSGQGITEYAAILAFVAVIIALVWKLFVGNGSGMSLSYGIWNAIYSAVNWLTLVVGKAH